MATTERYRRVRKPVQHKAEEIRVRTTGSQVTTVEQGQRCLLDMQGEKYIMLAGTGRAMANVVHVAEVLKRLIRGLHQQTMLRMQSIVDDSEPLDTVRTADGLGLRGNQTQQKVRRVPSLQVILALDVDKVDTAALGYQAPLPADLHNPYALEELRRDEVVWKSRVPRSRGESRTYRGFRGRGRGRGSPVDTRPPIPLNNEQAYPQTNQTPSPTPGYPSQRGRGAYRGVRGIRRGRARDGGRGTIGINLDESVPVVAA